MTKDYIELIVVAGSPVDGLEFYGPFDSTEEAYEWANRQCKGVNWWVTAIKDPEDDE